MENIKIHVLKTGEVRVSPYLPFGGDDCSIIKAYVVFCRTRKMPQRTWA